METEMVNALAKYLAPGHGLKQTKFLVFWNFSKFQSSDMSTRKEKYILESFNMSREL